MLINTESNTFKLARGVIGFAAGAGAGLLAGAAIRNLEYVPKNKYQTVVIAVATFAIGGLVNDVVNTKTKKYLTDMGVAINSIAESSKGVKVTVTDTLKA